MFIKTNDAYFKAHVDICFSICFLKISFRTHRKYTKDVSMCHDFVVSNNLGSFLQGTLEGLQNGINLHKEFSDPINGNNYHSREAQDEREQKIVQSVEERIKQGSLVVDSTTNHVATLFVDSVRKLLVYTNELICYANVRRL